MFFAPHSLQLPVLPSSERLALLICFKDIQLRFFFSLKASHFKQISKARDNDFILIASHSFFFPIGRLLESDETVSSGDRHARKCTLLIPSKLRIE